MPSTTHKQNKKHASKVLRWLRRRWREDEPAAAGVGTTSHDWNGRPIAPNDATGPLSTSHANVDPTETRMDDSGERGSSGGRKRPAPSEHADPLCEVEFLQLREDLIFSDGTEGTEGKQVIAMAQMITRDHQHPTAEIRFLETKALPVPDALTFSVGIGVKEIKLA